MSRTTKGSIIQLEKDKEPRRCRKWQLRVSAGKNPYTGKYETRTKVLNGTYTQAKAELDSFISIVLGENPVNPKAGNCTFEQFANDFTDLCLKRYNKGSNELTLHTIQRNSGNYKFVVKHLGNKIKIKDFTPELLSKFFDDLILENGYASSSVYAIYVSLSKLFKYANKTGVIRHNPLDKVPRPSKSNKERVPITPEQISYLLNNLDIASSKQFAVYLIASCGLRRSEVLAIKFGDVDLSTKRLYVSKSKTQSGYRYIPLMLGTFEAIQKRIEYLNTNMEQYGAHVTPDMPITANILGEGLKISALQYYWQHNRAKFGLPNTTLHELRHSFTTLLVLSGAPIKTVQELVGHKNVRTTLNVYTHININDKQKAMSQAWDYLESME